MRTDGKALDHWIRRSFHMNDMPDHELEEMRHFFGELKDQCQTHLSQCQGVALKRKNDQIQDLESQLSS